MCRSVTRPRTTVLRVVGIYEDVYRRVEGRWRIASRIVKPQMAVKMGNLV